MPPLSTQGRALAMAALMIAGGASAGGASAGGALAGGAATAADLPPERNQCTDPSSAVALGSAQWNGWGHDLDNTRYQPEPAIRATDVPHLALKWAFGYPGSAVSGQPTIVDGRVFVTSAVGRVYALDAKTGCSYWTYDAAAGVRSAVLIGELGHASAPMTPRPAPQSKKSKSKSKHKLALAHLEVQKAPSAVFFGDDHGAVYALDARRGTLLWKTQVDEHPSARIEAAPTLYQNRLYVAVASSELGAAADANYGCCTFRGSVAALDMLSGRIVWKTYTVHDDPRPNGKTQTGVQAFAPAGVPVLGAPVVDTGRGLLYVATGRSFTPIEQPLAGAIVALDLTDGSVRWAKQPLREGSVSAFDSSPILRTLASGKQVILATPRSGVVYGLDPDHAGEVLWMSKIAEAKLQGGVEWGAAADHRSLYVALSGLAAEPEDASGSLTALDLKTGAKRWQTPAPTPPCSWGERDCYHAQAQAVTVIPGAAFSGSMDGHLRAYSTIDGKILWDTETAKDYATVNGVKASGGSLDQGGATIVNGVVYINSGYGQRPGQPGNVLLAFSVAGK
jgi:polyvinyl alcohol dehydrogenase (cytochrome)